MAALASGAEEASPRLRAKRCGSGVFATAQTVLYQIGYRTQEIVMNVLSAAFPGELMTDGYGAYRMFPNRLRLSACVPAQAGCWAHLMRKLVGLSESTDRRVAAIGERLHAAFSDLQDAIYTARGSARIRRIRWRAHTPQ